MLDKRSRLLLKRLIEQYIVEGQPVGSRSLSKLRILMIVVSPEGDVHNRILLVERPYSQAQLVEAANALNQQFGGMSFEQARGRLRGELGELRQEMADLMEAAVQAGAEEAEQSDPVVVSGERNLIAI